MSSERSGSNLVRKMLAMHSDIAAPPPPHLWRHLSRVLPYYGSLAKEDNFREMVADAIALTQVRGSHLQWKYVPVPEKLLPNIRFRNLSGLLSVLYSWYASQEGVSNWVCKENNIFDHAFQIREVLPDARFIYLCRDGRDCACSIKKVPSHDQHIYNIAQEWRREQEECLRVYQELKALDAVCLLRYEDLLEHPEAELKRVCAFLGVAYQSEMLQFYTADEARSEAQKTDYWKNLSRPLMQNNKAKFLQQLPMKEIGLFEQVAGNVLRVLGYPLVTDTAVQPIKRIQHLRYNLQNKIQVYNRRRQLATDPGWQARQKLLKQIRRRKVDKAPSYKPLLDYKTKS